MHHHFIPEFYMWPWAEQHPTIKDHKLQVFGRDFHGAINTFRRGPGSTGYVPNLYALAGTTPETTHNVETKLFGPIDNEAAKIRDKMLAGEMPSSGAERYSWARFTWSLLLRTPEQIERMRIRIAKQSQNGEFLTEAEYQAMKPEGFPDTFAQFSEEEYKTGTDGNSRTAVLVLAKLIQHPATLKKLMELAWVRLDCGGKIRKLMTSDRPIVRPECLTKIGVQYVLPISPDKLFLAVEPTLTDEILAKVPVGKILRQVNRLVIGQAEKYVYAIDESCHSEVKKFMGKIPMFDVLKAG